LKTKLKWASAGAVAALLSLGLAMQAQTTEEADPSVAEDQAAEMSAEEAEWRAEAAAILADVAPERGAVSLTGTPVSLDVSSEFDFYDASESRVILEDLWGNPPDETVLGMIFPADLSPVDAVWGAVLTYEETGHVSDDDAATTDYAELLKSMQESTNASNEYRAAEGYDTVQLKGWAEEPRYDAAAHRLYWAKDLVFSGSEGASTLNYDMRLLGRRGVLSVNFIGPIEALAEVRDAAPALLAQASFNAGETYADYREGDKKAGYGVAALIAGGAGAAVLKKTGLLAVALIALKKFWIVIPIALLGLWRVVRGFFGGGAKS
jgi:uncharacterized membrane-anchored protein